MAEAVVDLGSAGVTEIAEEVGRSKATVHHHLSTLTDHGYLVTDDGTYEPSLQFFEIGQRILQHKDVYQAGTGPLRELAEETGEVANLMVEENGKGIYVAIEEGAEAINLDTSVGSEQYLHTCALGKAILAHLPSSRRDEIVDRWQLPAETPRTVTDRDRLEDVLADVRERGVAFDGEERAANVRCVAAPITTNEGTVLGAVSVSGPASRMKDDRLESTLVDQVENTATVIALNATYR
nr:IclR family transcriptional regulator [Haloplanus sp. HW8-1]